MERLAVGSFGPRVDAVPWRSLPPEIADSMRDLRCAT